MHSNYRDLGSIVAATVDTNSVLVNTARYNFRQLVTPADTKGASDKNLHERQRVFAATHNVVSTH